MPILIVAGNYSSVLSGVLIDAAFMLYIDESYFHACWQIELYFYITIYDIAVSL